MESQMTREEFLTKMDEILELIPGTLKGSESLDDLEGWTSLAMVSYIALADTNNGNRPSPREIAKCATVADLLELAKVAPAVA